MSAPAMMLAVALLPQPQHDVSDSRPRTGVEGDHTELTRKHRQNRLRLVNQILVANTIRLL